MRKFKRVCVFCGSNSGNRKIYSDAALELGRELVERKMDLIYGGGSIGLMGLVSQAVFDGGCSVLGVIPAALVPLEISGHAVGEVLVASDMHLICMNVNLTGVVGGFVKCGRILRLLTKGVEDGFIKPSDRTIVVSANTPRELIQRMQEYIPLHDQVASSKSWKEAPGKRIT